MGSITAKPIVLPSIKMFRFIFICAIIFTFVQGRVLNFCQIGVINCCSSDQSPRNNRCFALNGCPGVHFVPHPCSFYSYVLVTATEALKQGRRYSESKKC